MDIKFDLVYYADLSLKIIPPSNKDNQKSWKNTNDFTRYFHYIVLQYEVKQK